MFPRFHFLNLIQAQFARERHHPKKNVLRILEVMVDNRKSCAYCGGSGRLTKEHILPAFLFRRYPEQRSGIPPKSHKVAKFEGTIKDVCGSCNSGPLSELDAYAQAFTEQNRCDRTFERKRPSLLILYEYEMLLRWLLKISFNAMRAVDRTNEISKSVGFILGAGPLSFDCEIFVEVIRNVPIADHQRHKLPASLKNSSSLTAHRFRLGGFGFSGGENVSVCRFVAINAFYFYVMLFPLTTQIEEREKILLMFRRGFPYAFRLKPARRSVNVKVSKNTLDDVYREQFLRELPAWKEYFSQIDSANL